MALVEPFSSKPGFHHATDLNGTVAIVFLTSLAKSLQACGAPSGPQSSRCA